MLTRRRTAWAVIAAAIAVTLLLAVGVGVDLGAGRSELLWRQPTGDAPSQLARRDIPATLDRSPIRTYAAVRSS